MKKFEDFTAADLIASRHKSDITEDITDSTYRPVRLSSMGKLGLPAVIHVRDYSYSDALQLASASTGAEMIQAIIKVLANVIKEDIELDKLTSQDVLEILITIQGTWYSPIMEFPYYVDETLPSDKLTSKENMSKATIQVNSIKTKPFPEDRKVPLDVSMEGFKAVVDIPRFYNEVIVGQFIDRMYSEQDGQMEVISNKIKDNTNTLEEYKSYMKYKENRTLDLIKATQAIQVLSINGRELHTLEERFNAMDEFPVRAWSAVSSFIQDELNFGVQSEVTFNCTVTGKTITRRFPFRILDFIPTLEYLKSSGDSISIC